MSLNGRARQQQIDLIVAVPEAAQVLDDAQRGLAVRDGGVEVVLLPRVEVDAEALKVDHPARPELRLDGARDEDGALEPERAHAVLEHAELERDDPSHLDGAAEGDFAVALCVSRPSVGVSVSDC